MSLTLSVTECMSSLDIYVSLTPEAIKIFKLCVFLIVIFLLGLLHLDFNQVLRHEKSVCPVYLPLNRQVWGLTEGTLIFLRPQCPVTRTHLRQRETESYNILNCSNNKTIYITIYRNGLFVLINELLRDKVIAIGIPYSAFIRTSTTDTNSNSSLADNLNCVL